MLFSKTYRDQKIARIETMSQVTPADAERAGDAAWQRYTAKFDEPARKHWQAGFDKELAAYDGDFIAPLASAHAQWMRSEAMRTAMRTSSMPVWPQDVEAESPVSADDPYARDATANPSGLQ